MNSALRRILALCLMLCLIASVAAANLSFDINKDGKTTVWDLQQTPEADQADALEEAIGGKDELHKNEDGQWEIWTKLGLYHMAELAQSGDTFVLMQDIDLEGNYWQPVEGFNGKLLGNCHTVSNMVIKRSNDGNLGFFGSIAESGVVELLNLSEMDVQADADSVNIGLIAGTCAGLIDGSTASGFITDLRTTLPANVKIGGMAGKMVVGGSIVSRDINKLPEVDADQTIKTISAQIGTRFAELKDSDYQRIVGIVGEGESAVDAGTLLQDLTGKMPDPHAYAWVQNGDVMTFTHNLKETLAAIQPDGNTVITLQEDVTATSAITIPYTCTIDCNGHSINTPADKNNGLDVMVAGTENQTFTLKNGTFRHYAIGVRSTEGAVVISNMTIISNGGAPIGLYDTTDYSAINRIEDSTLVSKKWGCIVFNQSKADMSGTGITIENSDLISGVPTGSVVFVNQAAQSGTITLGNNVNLYTCSENVTSNVPLAGVDPFKLEGTADVTVDGVTYSGLNRWTTDEAVISTEIIAEVTNGDTTVEVANSTDLIANIRAEGTTQVKLVKDIVRTSTLSIPYSCTIDLNGYSITSNSGTAVAINGVGSVNKVTKIMNGRLNHGAMGVQVNAGALDLSDVEIFGIGSCGVSVGYCDPDSSYRAYNKIDGCTFYNPKSACIGYQVANVNFHETGVSITNTTLIAQKEYAFNVLTSEMSGIIELGEGVEIYSSKTAVAPSFYRFLGLLAYRTEKTSVTVDGTEITGMKHWSTDAQEDIINILLIGNSLSTTIPEELYQIATKAGYEVNVANLYYPGCKAWQHWDWLNNDIANYQYRHYSQMGASIRRGDMSTSGYALDDIDWDYIVYQDWFMPDDAANLDMLYERHQESAYNMMQYLKTNYPNAKHLYYQHWAWAVGRTGTETVAAQTNMWNMINTATTKFAADNDFILIPCGLAYQVARANEKIGDTLCKDDKLHDDGVGGGQYLNGCVFFETIFQKSCIGDTWRASNGPSEEKHQLLQLAAHEAVATVHGENYAK